MAIITHGIDLVDFPRIEDMVKRHGERFLDRVFTTAEQAYAKANKNSVEKLAGRFAAKEAVLKLLGTGWRGKIAWTDIEIVNTATGQPEVKLSGEVKKIADEIGITQISVSITHTANFAIASAITIVSVNKESFSNQTITENEQVKGKSLDEIISEKEREIIIDALKKSGGLQRKAARTLGITERILGYKIKKYDIHPKFL